jgi:hypothetical protein
MTKQTLALTLAAVASVMATTGCAADATPDGDDNVVVPSLDGIEVKACDPGHGAQCPPPPPPPAPIVPYPNPPKCDGSPAGICILNYRTGQYDCYVGTPICT